MSGRTEAKIPRRVGPAARDIEMAAHDRHLRAPWTQAQLEAVREAAVAIVRSHLSVDAPGGEVLTVVGGAEFWALMVALDRPRRRW